MTAEEASARLKAMAMVVRYGHDLFAAKDFGDAATAVVGNAKALLDYRTSALFEVRSGRATVIAQYAQPEVNPHSAWAVEKGAEIERWLKTRTDGEKGDVAEGGELRLLLPLPANTDGADFSFVWVVEYEGEVPAFAATTAKLLVGSAGEALCYQRLCKAGGWRRRGRFGKFLFWCVVLAAAVAAMFIPVEETVNAEFSLAAPEVTRSYAWFDGAVARCLRNDGETVTNGETVVVYDTKQLEYRLGTERNRLAEIEAELALARQNAFLDQKELGRSKLLEAQRDAVKVGVEEAEWYLAHAEVKARSDGTVSLADGRAERLENKAVRAGDELFAVMGGVGMLAEIPVSERDASVLGKELKVELYLHSAPETAIEAEVLEVAQQPILTEQRTYAYPVRVRLLKGNPAGLRYGMRGVAKLSGGQVTLGYRMFKSVVLYFRGL